MRGETGANPVRARRREAHAINRKRVTYLPRCHNLGKAIGET